MDSHYFCHSSTGTLLYDPGQGTRHFEPWWALLLVDDGILAYHAWLLRRQGIEVDRGSRWGPHVCFVRGEEPTDRNAWGFDPGPVTFHYANLVRWDNGRHAWLDVWCPTLTELRARLGVPVKPKTTYHLTIGRLRLPRATAKSNSEGDHTLIL